MKVRRALFPLILVAVCLALTMQPNLISAQGSTAGNSLSIKHEIATSGLPFFNTIVVQNVQDIQGDKLCRQLRSSVIKLNDSVVSDVAVVTITDLEKNKQIYINTKNKTYAEHVFDQSEFPVIDSVADSKGPQMEIRKTGQSKVIDGRKCSEIYFKLDKSTQTGVGEAKVKHYFEGTMWVTQDIPSYKLYLAYNDRAHSYLRGTRYMGGGFFDILAKLDVDQYNLLRLIRAMDGIPVEASFIAQLPSDQGGNVFESKIKMLEVSDKPFKEGHFGFPTDPTFKQVPANEFKSF